MYQQCVTAAVLAGCTYTDIRFQKIYKKAVWLYFALATVGRLTEGIAGLPEVLSGMAPGLCCLGISRATREGLGYGDSALILVCGISLGLWTCMETVMLAFFLAGIWAMLLLCRYHKAKKRSFPFVPFLLIGYFLQSMLSA